MNRLFTSSKQQVCGQTLRSSRSNIRGVARNLSKPDGVNRFIARAESGSESSSSGVETPSTSQATAPPSEKPVVGPDAKIKRTLSDLNALLGIDEEEEARQKAKEREAPKKKDDKSVSMTISPDVLKQIADAEASRAGTTEMSKPMAEQLQKIMEQAKKVADTEPGSAQAEQKLRREFESLLSMLKPDSAVKKEDLDRIKKELLNPITTFYVTETRPLDDLTGGYLIRGNVRGKDARKVFDDTIDGVRKMFDGKYEVLVVEDPIALAEGDRDLKTGQPKIALMLLPASATKPEPTAPWQSVAALVLLLLTVGSALQLGLVANVTKLPPETIKALSNPDAYDPNLPIPGLSDLDVIKYVESALPITYGALTTNIVHEAGHRIAAGIKKVKLGASFFLPNGQLGSFGAVTPLKSLVRDRATLWDVAFAGPLAGAAASLALFIYGLSLSTGGDVPAAELVPVPTQLFQGSLLLGGLSRVALGANAMATAQVGIHPLMIAGWCGLVTTALNLLPVGCLDGGRMMQAAFGRQSLNITSLFSYLGLALGLLGSSLALPFGLYVLFIQRDPEKFVQDEVSGVGETRQAVTALVMILALLILLPLAPEVNDAGVGIGPGGLFI